MNAHFKACIGEFIGTYILVFIGCGTVFMHVMGHAFGTLLSVALMWGLAVCLAIFSVRKFSSAHLNPAVSLAFVVFGLSSWKDITAYILCQFLGAFSAAVALFYTFQTQILKFELEKGIIRGTKESQETAKMFGEFFNMDSNNFLESHLIAFTAEALGTFLLMLVILISIHLFQRKKYLQPFSIAFGLSAVIYLIAPYTQAGLNPARDFGPRLVAYFFGWGNAAFPSLDYSFFTVYMLAPCAGAIMAVFAWDLFKIGKNKLTSKESVRNKD